MSMSPSTQTKSRCSSSKIQVTILGSGTCVPSLQRSACALLIETDVSKIVLDAGPGTMHRLLEAGTAIFDVDFIFLSHFHPDHSGELVPFLFSNKYPDGEKRRKPLTVGGGKGLGKFVNGLRNVYGHWIELAPGLLKLIEFNNAAADAHHFEDFTLQSIPVAHNPESIAFRITAAEGQSVVYSGDTDFCEDLIDLAQTADLFVCESAFPDDLKTSGHLTPSLAGEIATRAHVRQLILTHFYPECDNADIVKECRKTYAGPLRLAQDLLQISL